MTIEQKISEHISRALGIQVSITLGTFSRIFYASFSAPGQRHHKRVARALSDYFYPCRLVEAEAVAGSTTFNIHGEPRKLQSYQISYSITQGVEAFSEGDAKSYAPDNAQELRVSCYDDLREEAIDLLSADYATLQKQLEALRALEDDHEEA